MVEAKHNHFISRTGKTKMAWEDYEVLSDLTGE